MGGRIWVEGKEGDGVVREIDGKYRLEVGGDEKIVVVG